MPRRLGASLLSLFAVAAVALRPAPAVAQSSSAEAQAPANLAFVEGTAMLERQGRVEAAVTSMPIVAGDRIRTDRGRVEILFADGSALDLDEFTTLDLQSDTLLRLLSGRMRLLLEGSANQPVTLRVDTPGGSVNIHTTGDYRLSLTGAGTADQVEVAVLRGEADLATGQGSVAIRTGERAIARADGPPSYAYAYNSAAWDAFDAWSEDRRRTRLGVVSTQYLPDDLQAYGGTFDRYGAWRQDPVYGAVWYPSAGVGWSPYFNGYWSFVTSIGWTWIGYDRWAWPTHHFGRWGFSGGAWFWIPGRRWGPAWVSWAWAPSYVAWCPLGFNGRPVVGINVFVRGVHRGHGPHPWRGWTVVPTRHFGAARRAVSAYAVPVGRLDQHTRATFVPRTAIARPRGVAVPRSAAPITRAGLRPGGPSARPAPRARPFASSRAGLRTDATGPRGRASVRVDRRVSPPLGSVPRRTPQSAPAQTIRIIGQPRAAGRGAARRTSPVGRPPGERNAPLVRGDEVRSTQPRVRSRPGGAIERKPTSAREPARGGAPPGLFRPVAPVRTPAGRAPGASARPSTPGLPRGTVRPGMTGSARPETRRATPQTPRGFEARPGPARAAPGRMAAPTGARQAPRAGAGSRGPSRPSAGAPRAATPRGATRPPTRGGRSAPPRAPRGGARPGGARRPPRG